MGKVSKSYSVQEYLARLVDEMPGKNSAVVNEALKRYLLTDGEALDNEIEKAEKELERRRMEKQKKERELWEWEDKVEDLKDMRSQAKAVQEVKERIGRSRIEAVSKVVKQNKYDSRSGVTETQIIEKHVEMIVEEYPDLDEETVLETLRTFVNV